MVLLKNSLDNVEQIH